MQHAFWCRFSIFSCFFQDFRYTKHIQSIEVNSFAEAVFCAPSPGYTGLTDAVLDAVPMLHTSGRYLLDGGLTDTLPADCRELVERMQWVQYYLTQDAGGIHPE